MLTLPAQIAEAIAKSPVLAKPPIRFGVVLPEPIQPLREIRAAGFDAIVQMTDELMSIALNRSVPAALRRIDSAIPEGIDSTLEDEISDRVAAKHIEAEVISYPIGLSRRVTVELQASALLAQLSLSGVSVSHGIDPIASIRISVTLSVVTEETEASYASRVDSQSFRRAPPPFRDRLPVGSDPVTTEIELARLIIVISGPVSARVDEARFAIDTSLDFTTADVSMVGSSAWGPTVLNLLSPQIRGWGHREIAPQIRLFGDPPFSPIPEATRFDVTIAGAPSNQLGSTLIFGIETAAGSAAPDVTQVGASTGSGNFAFFATEPIMVGTILSRWRSLPQRWVELTVPFVVMREGVRREGSMRIRYELGDALGASMSYGTEYMSDNVLVSTIFRSQAVSARLGGRDVSGELGDLTTPRETHEMFTMFMDHSPVHHSNEMMENWLLAAGRHLLPPLLRPVSSSWKLLGNYEAIISKPLSAMVTRGVLV
jgi:hypothetical protein